MNLLGKVNYLDIRRVTSLMNYSESLTSIALLTYQTIPIWKAVLKQILSSYNLSFKNCRSNFSLILCCFSYENALQSSESSDFLKFNLRYLSIEEGYRYVRHGVGKPWLHTFWFWKNFGHKNSSWRTPRPNVIYCKIRNLRKIHKNKDIEKNMSS